MSRARVAEHIIRSRPLGPKLRLRVDLHGVSVFGPGERRTLVRWEWIREISVTSGVLIRSGNAEILLPPHAFGLTPEVLAQRLDAARSIEKRPEVIGELATP